MSSNQCHSCEGLTTITPKVVYNRPGLSAIAYRVGTHPDFRQSMLARLSGADQFILPLLTSRNTDDFSIALCDAWATVADVLTFYQERIANELYLRTATERMSVLEMARLIGYELRPGVAAATHVAFTMEDAPGALNPLQGPVTRPTSVPPVTLAAGIKIQSIPGPGEQAQTFETIRPITARPEWNNIRPLLTQPSTLQTTASLLILKGTSLNLKQGDIILIRNNGVSVLKKVLQVITDTDNNTTRVNFTANAALPPYNEPQNIPPGDINELFLRSQPDMGTINKIMIRKWKEEDLSVLIAAKKWEETDLLAGIMKARTPLPPAAGNGVFVFRKRAAAFGYNAPREITFNNTTKLPVSTEWALSETSGKVYLDSTYEEVVPGSYIGVQHSSQTLQNTKVYQADKVDTLPRTAYSVSARSTVINLLPAEQWWETGQTLAAVRGITFYMQSEQLEQAPLPLPDHVTGSKITLERMYPGLKPGQQIILSGERSELKGTAASEVMELKEVMVIQGLTVLTFRTSLTYTYIRNSVYINANIAPATHGETVEEVLGSGNAGRIFQQFTLRQPPLTYISEASASGVLSTLEIRVNDLLWKEVPAFFGHGPEERIYIVRLDDDGKSTVIFGDGITGARLPTGVENIKARYRKGIGLGGLVKSSQLSQLLTRPLGVKSAVNPVAATGAASRERLDEARRNAPLTILTLDRIVSLQDYEDFARAFTGIEKSLATWTWQAQQRRIFITVAGAGGAAVPTDSMLYSNLLQAIRNAGDPRVSVTVKSYQPRYFQVTANIKTAPDYLSDKVIAAANDALRQAFSFQERAFGQPVTYSEVIAVIQQVKGVVAVDIDKLYHSDTGVHSDFLEARLPIIRSNDALPAELLTLDPRPIDLKLIV